jgi:hypothetical protein
LRPSVAKGLQSLLDYEADDLEDVFCLSFEATYESFGENITVPLIPGGESISVSQLNKKEYVDSFVSFIFNESVDKHFQAFKNGFYNVAGGNALSLFTANEIEMLVRGNDDALDLAGLESITVYEGGDFFLKKRIRSGGADRQGFLGARKLKVLAGA